MANDSLTNIDTASGVNTINTAPAPAKDSETRRGEPVKGLSIEFEWQTGLWEELFDKQVGLIQGDIRRALIDDRQVVYLSCPISSRGGSFFAANVEIANHTQQRLLMNWGTGFWILNPAQYQMESKEGTGLIEAHARALGKEEELRKLREANKRPTGGDYMRMWTRVLAEDGYLGKSDHPENTGHCFSAYYFLGPSDVRDFFTKDGALSLTAGVEEYLARKITSDPVFENHFSYPMRDENGNVLKDEKGKELTRERQAEEWERRRKDFFRYDTIRASINFSKGSHDEWNIIRLLNVKRLQSAYKELGLGNQIVAYFDGKQVAPSASEATVSAGYAV